MNILRLSRFSVIGLGVFAILCSVGGALLGVPIRHGGYIALSCLMAGVSLACLIWWRESFFENRTPQDHLVAASFAIASGLALYANLTWALWAIGVPIDIGTVRDGRMSEHYWLGPLTLVYAVVCYAVLHWPFKSRANQ